MDSPIRPVGANLCVKRLEAATRTPGGIFLPENATEKPRMGVVLAVGRDAFRPTRYSATGPDWPKERGVTEGETVIFSSYSGTEFEIDGETFLILADKDVLGVVNAEAALA
ncbi:MAG TPA: co-chaperone GroES [Thermoleophilia bacterium]|nr:co-chaperone GroES [Thermoleophilia bacterium]